MKPSIFAAAAVSLAMTLAAPASADPDSDFVHELQSYGIYGPRDYNAWLGKITCERLHNGLDRDAAKSTWFIGKNLPRGTTQAQVWQFFGASINTYCPDQRGVFEAAATQHG